MDKRYLIALDEGTSSVRSLLYDIDSNRIAAVMQKPIAQYYPQQGYVEEDAQEIFEAQIDTLHQLLESENVDPREVAGIGITNQRETTVVWDRTTGRPIANAIVWQCRRTAAACEELYERGLAPLIQSKTGLLPDAYFSATKIAWLLDNVAGAREAAARGELLAGTIETWLLWKLTGGLSHCTDVTNASRTMLFNIHTLDWDDELLELFDIPRALLPRVLPSGAEFGNVSPSLPGGSIPVLAMIGDQQSALFGQRCFEAGNVKNTYGTGCFVLMNIGGEVITSSNRLLTTVAWQQSGEPPVYAAEGSIFNAGSIVQWMRDSLGLVSTAAETERMSMDAGESDVVLVPAFTGLGAPYWDMYARGMLIGMTRDTGREHIVRAGLESIVFQVKDVLDAMQRDSGKVISLLKADGGAAANSFLMQSQADLLGIPVRVPDNVESTAMGAIYMAGLTAGVWKSVGSISALPDGARTYLPSSGGAISAKYHRWVKAVERAKGWSQM